MLFKYLGNTSNVAAMMDNYRDDRSSTAKDSDAESASLDKEALLGKAQPRPSTDITNNHEIIVALVSYLGRHSGRGQCHSRGRPHCSVLEQPAPDGAISGHVLAHAHAHTHSQAQLHHDDNHNAKKPTPFPMGVIPHVDARPD